MSKYNLTEIFNESFDSLAKKLDKQKGIDKEDAAKIAGSIAAKKMKGAGSGPTAKQKARVKEEEVSEITSDTRNRIDGMVNQKFLSTFLTSFGEMYADLSQDDPFDSEDILEYLEEVMRRKLKEQDMYMDNFTPDDMKESIKEDEEEDEEEIVQYEPFVEGETFLRRTEFIDRRRDYQYLLGSQEEYDYLLKFGPLSYESEYLEDGVDEIVEDYEEIRKEEYSLGNDEFNTDLPSIQEDLFSKDGDTEDNVDNIDKVSSPSTKGVGYDQVSKANTAEDDMESKETLNPKPMYEDLKKHFKRFI